MFSSQSIPDSPRSCTPPFILELPSLKVTSIQYLKQIPACELYRLMIDGCQHKDDGWLSYANREVGCLSGLYSGLKIALSDLNLLVSAEYIQNIHQACASYQVEGKDVVVGNKSLQPGQFRTCGGGFYFFDYGIKHRNNFLSEEGFYEFFDSFLPKYQKYGAFITEVVDDENGESLPYYARSDLIPSKKTKEELWQLIKDKKALFYRAPHYRHLKCLLDKCCDEFNNQMRLEVSADRKLEKIIRFVKEIELIHAFNDFNGRTSLALLQRVLIQHDFLPVMLFDPNYIDGYSVTELMYELKIGMNNVLSLIESPDRPLFSYSSKQIDVAVNRLLNINKTFSSLTFFAPELIDKMDYDGPSGYAMALHGTRIGRCCLIVAPSMNNFLKNKLSMMEAAYVRADDKLYAMTADKCEEVMLDSDMLHLFDQTLQLSNAHEKSNAIKLRVLTQGELVKIKEITNYDIGVHKGSLEVLHDFLLGMNDNFVQEMKELTLFNQLSDESRSSPRPF